MWANESASKSAERHFLFQKPSAISFSRLSFEMGASVGFIARFEIALNVFAENVGFEIYRVAGFTVAKVGVLVGVENYRDFQRKLLL